MLYSRYLDTKVSGKAFIPPFGGFIVAANHSSHLDMGLVKHTLGDNADRLVALAAKDYFFEDPVRKAYFENFTNLVPMERHGSLRESLRLAGEVLREGYILLIFPEGTRSTTGIMTDFKPSLGYLALSNHCGILPMYLGGTHDAMPKGAYLPKRQEVIASVGPFQSYEALCLMTKGLKRSESYRHIAYRTEESVRAMAPNRFEWTLGESGREPAAAAVAAATKSQPTGDPGARA
jgi:long-chain acyl-CoA synthetase